MKMVTITYSQALDDVLMEILEQCKVETYTKWTQVMGRGTNSGLHLMTNVWPKGNNVLLIATNDEQAKKIMDGVKDLRRTAGHEGVKAFLAPLEAVT